MRLAELLISAALMALSVFFMAYAVELPIGWEPGAGPGGGAFPFWLGLIMLIASAVVFVRELSNAHHVWRRYSGVDEAGNPRPAGHAPGDESDDPFIEPSAVRDILIASGALFATIAAMPIVGTYVAVPLFLIAYLRFFAGHGWLLTGLIALITPIVMFFFFEVTLKILLPKGATEPLFIPLYAIFF
ncbi:MAG: tripartite tricarboxylate transporter TctB family protein [Pseudomonadota bacterium]